MPVLVAEEHRKAQRLRMVGGARRVMPIQAAAIELLEQLVAQQGVIGRVENADSRARGEQLAVQLAHQLPPGGQQLVEAGEDPGPGRHARAARERVVGDYADAALQRLAPLTQIVPNSEVALGLDDKVDHAERRSPRARITAELKLPVTLVTVLKMSGMASTASRITTPSIGAPAAR